MNPNERIVLSVVSPVYGCETSLTELYLRLRQTLETITLNFEVILVNDGGPESTWALIKELNKRDGHVKGLNLSKNYGQHPAINAGLKYAKGDWIVVIDCDLQDKPEEILKMYNKAQEGYDIVFAKRIFRQDNVFKKAISRIFYIIFNYLSDIKTDYTVANFGIYSKNVITEYNNLKESGKIFPIVVRQIGFKTGSIEVDHGKRDSGKSGYSIFKLVKLALGIIISQSNKPLYLSIFIGFVIAFMSFFYGIYLLVRYYVLNVPPGYTSIIAAILFIGGLLFCNLGLLGLYFGKVLNEIKGKPDYIAKEFTSDEQVL
jgi:polyisoprenyl-phosphate glycosyltransferase